MHNACILIKPQIILSNTEYIFAMNDTKLMYFQYKLHYNRAYYLLITHTIKQHVRKHSNNLQYVRVYRMAALMPALVGNVYSANIIFIEANMALT